MPLILRYTAKLNTAKKTNWFFTVVLRYILQNNGKKYQNRIAQLLQGVGRGLNWQ